jgi:hypothetical protein
MTKPTKADKSELKKLLGKDFDAIERYVLEQHEARLAPDEIGELVRKRFPGHSYPPAFWEILIPAPPGAS